MQNTSIQLTKDQYSLEVQKYKNDLNFELSTGYNGLTAGFIGEIIIVLFDDIIKARLQASIEISKETGVPVMISIDDNHDVLEQLIIYLKEELDYDSPKVIIQVS